MLGAILNLFSRKRLLVEYMLIAGLVMLGGMTAGMWAMKRELSIRLDATEKQSEYFSERLQIARDYIETQHKTIEEMRDTMKRNENALSKLSRTVQHANETDAEFRKEYEKLKSNRETLDFLNTRVPDDVARLLNGDTQTTATTNDNPR